MMTNVVLEEQDKVTQVPGTNALVDGETVTIEIDGDDDEEAE